MTKLSLDAFEKATEEEMVIVSGGSGGGSAWANEMRARGMSEPNSIAPSGSAGTRYTSYVVGFGITNAAAVANNMTATQMNQNTMNSYQCTKIGSMEVSKVIGAPFYSATTTYECNQALTVTQWGTTIWNN